MKKKIYSDQGKSVAWYTQRLMALKTAGIKTASLLLITMTGFSMMSFAYDDTIINNAGNNQNAARQKKSQAVVSPGFCCVYKMDKPGDEMGNLLLSMPDEQSIFKADLENAVLFLKETAVIKILDKKLVAATGKDEKEVYDNFQISHIYTSGETSTDADAEMIERFADEIVSGLHSFSGSYTEEADAEVAAHFMAAHFSIEVNSLQDLELKADVEMRRVFETANMISVAAF